MDLTYDSDTNSLRLTPTPSGVCSAPSHVDTLDAILDIGESGRLIGVEFPSDATSLTHWQRDPATSPFITHDDGRAYIQITTGNAGASRSTPITVSAEYDAAHHLTTIAIPRRGHGYEISYPSGNQ